MNGQPDWSAVTWEGARRAQLRDWAKLSLYEKFKAVEELEAVALAMLKARKERGEAYVDPDTGKVVSGSGDPGKPDG